MRCPRLKMEAWHNCACFTQLHLNMTSRDLGLPFPSHRCLPFCRPFFCQRELGGKKKRAQMAAVAGPAPAPFDKGHQKRRGAAQPGVYTCFIWPKGREKGNDTLSPTDAVAGARRNHQGLNNRRSQGKKKKRQKLFNQTAIEISVEFRTGQ